MSVTVMSVLPVTDVQWWTLLGTCTVLGTHVCDCDVSIASHWCTVMNITRHTCLWLWCQYCQSLMYSDEHYWAHMSVTVMSVLPVTDVQWWTLLGTCTLLGTHVCDCDVSIANHWCTVMNITRDMYITRHTCLWLWCQYCQSLMHSDEHY